MKTVPAAEFVEMAIDAQPKEDAAVTADKLKELRSAAWEDGHDAQFARGYLIGLKTAELLLAGRGMGL